MLDSSVLVLNRLWQAVNLCSARRAFCLLYVDHVHVVLESYGSFDTLDFERWRELSARADGDDVVHSVNYKLLIPHVVVLRYYDRLPRIEVKYSRANVFRRDRDTCQYCGRKLPKKDLNLDHVVPRHLGGETTWENVVCSCIECNLEKAHRTLGQAGFQLIHQPKKPFWRPFWSEGFSEKRHRSWSHFLGLNGGEVRIGDGVSSSR